ncbi:MAG: mechanosensitive ion channel family protein [Candidatus Eisenbacteria bacterium]|nr:mechanosensitive ion channel family protein [Candidatus Eisenbacteria bacterium]
MAFDWRQVFNPTVFMKWVFSSGIRIAGILLVAFVVTRLAGFITRRIERAFEDDDPTTLSEREKRAATIGKVVRNLVRVAAWGVAALMVLRELGIDIAPILAGVGIAGLAVGFGAQSLVKDFLAGVFILLENQFRVGDVIETAGVSGVVERITLRSTTLRDVRGNVHVIPNGAMAVVTNMTKQWSRFVLDLGVSYGEDVDRVIAVLKSVGDELVAAPEFREKISQPVQVLGVQDFGESSVVIRVSFTTKPQEQWAVGREFRRRVKKAFDEQGIRIPFPQRDVWIRWAGPGGPAKEAGDVPEDPRRR